MRGAGATPAARISYGLGDDTHEASGDVAGTVPDLPI
jgi:hypothetical protein